MGKSKRWEWGLVLAVFLFVACGACDSSTEPSKKGGLPPIQLVTDFEGASLGNWSHASPYVFDLEIRNDTNSDFARWYSFRVLGGRNKQLTFHITNAAQVSAPGAWSFNQPAVSSDGGATWDRISATSYEGGIFSFQYTPASVDEWIALGPTYNFSRWTSLSADIESHPMVDSLVVLTQTLMGRPVHLVKVTDPSVPDIEKGAVWATARQHPAEVAGSWMAEGLLLWLLSDDPQVVELRRRAVFYLVPFMNPDGVALGNYRVNSVGANLNREWANRNPATAPSVAATAQAIEDYVASGGRFEFFVDLHAYSSLRKNFFFYSGRDRAPEEEVLEMEALMDLFEATNGDFTRSGSSSSSDDTRLARGWAFENFGVQAVTFEASYQDITYGPSAYEYMTPSRYLALGEGLGKSLAELIFGVGP